MADMEKVIKWFEYDYLTRVGAYRKDCKQGCDACVPMHDGDDYCDIDMLCKVLALLKEQEAVVRCKDCKWWDKKDESPYGYCHACKHGYSSPNWEIGIYRTYKGDWFCADGERKEGR